MPEENDRGRTQGLTEGPAPALAAVVLVTRAAGRELGRLRMESGTVLVGSGPGNDLVIDHPTVSRKHAELQLRPDGLFVRDLGSRNGIGYQGAKVREVLVAPGAVLKIGRVELRVERTEQAQERRLGGLASIASPMMAVIDQLAAAADSPATVLLEGETGSGKEIAARALHQAGSRSARPFEVVDCASIPAGLAAGALFGHVRGAFTGAERDQPGAFERADGGTLFLDEIGELPADLQPLLLRALERREVRRVGGQKWQHVDVRVIAATNRDLEREATAGRFRSDLFHRLAVVRLRIPALRERSADIPRLVRGFLDELGPRAEGISLSAETVAALSRYHWPGNVRELKNLVERTVTLSPQHSLDPETLGLDAEAPAGPGQEDYHAARARALEAFERDFLEQLLARNDGNVSRAAKEAGIDRVYLHRLIKKHGIRSRG